MKSQGQNYTSSPLIPSASKIYHNFCTELYSQIRHQLIMRQVNICTAAKA